MSVQGKNTLSYKKQNVTEQKIPSTGVKNITFAHEFTIAGEDAILFNSLNAPTEWTNSGLNNPSGTSLLAAHLEMFKSNVEVVSSARGYIQKSEYVVKNNGIYFKNITSLVNEVFEVKVSDILVTGRTVVDMRTIRVEGELLDTTTDFNIGYELNVFNEEIIVYRDGAQMFRSDNNDSSGTSGNYYYVDTDGDGKSSVIRFFDAAIGDEPILIASTGGIVDSPNVSTFQQIETLAGQIDNMVPTLAALAGVPEGDFQTAPNNVDLKNFGDKLGQLEQDTLKNMSTEFLGNLFNNFVKVGYYRAQNHAGYGSTNTVIPYYTSETNNVNFSQFGTIENDSANGWSFTASQRCLIFVNVTRGAIPSGGSAYVGLSLDSNQLSNAILTINPDHILTSGYENASNTHLNCSSLVLMEPGQVLRPHHDGTGFTASRANINIIGLSFFGL